MNGCARLDPVLGYVPAIPEQFWERHRLFWSRARCCECWSKFKTRSEYETHYALTHIESDRRCTCPQYQEHGDCEHL